ncbi:MAG: hypothetical protein HQL09_02150 [Nitrospirae bacterium]|nr:hypothetical protein [Nitrospirota bacterium]
MVDKKTGILIALPFIAIAAAVLLLPYAKFEPSVSGSERQLAGFTTGNIPSISKREPFTASALDSPIKIAVVQNSPNKTFPGESLSQLAPPPGTTHAQAAPLPKADVVSLIVVNNDNKMAIINGKVVREGEKSDGRLVVKIEKNRVLLKDKTESKWLKIE